MPYKERPLEVFQAKQGELPQTGGEGLLILAEFTASIFQASLESYDSNDQAPILSQSMPSLKEKTPSKVGGFIVFNCIKLRFAL